MRVLNVMLSEGRGGIEASFANYAVALQTAGIDVTCCVVEGALIKESLSASLPVFEIKNRSQLDPRALLQAAKLVRTLKPKVILVHGRRAYIIFALMRRIFGKSAPLVQVLHRPRFKRLRYSDQVITVSEQLRAQVIAHGIDAARVSAIPNFLTETVTASPRPFATPAVMGVLGRLVAVKGVDLFLEALALLKARGVSFTARIGGSGALHETLKAQAMALGVDDAVQWLGWVDDNPAFFEGIDVFCLPSRAESFGLVVLEAFAHGKLVVSTRTSGPSELIADGDNGLLCDIDAEALADALARALGNTEQSAVMAANGLRASERYTMAAVTPQIVACLNQVIARFSGTAH